jgi:hypothetical protein
VEINLTPAQMATTLSLLPERGAHPSLPHTKGEERGVSALWPVHWGRQQQQQRLPEVIQRKLLCLFEQDSFWSYRIFPLQPDARPMPALISCLSHESQRRR